MTNARNSYIGKLIIAVGKLVSQAIPVAIGLAVLFFFWGLAIFMFKAGDEKAHEAGKNRMIWGVVALFVLVAVWGLVSFLGVVVGLPPLPSQRGVDNPVVNPFQQNV